MLHVFGNGLALVVSHHFIVKSFPFSLIGYIRLSIRATWLANKAEKNLNSTRLFSALPYLSRSFEPDYGIPTFLRAIQKDSTDL